MIGSLTQGLHLAHDERDHIFRLIGQACPWGARTASRHPGLLRIFSRLYDTPAEIVIELGETLRQTAPGIAPADDPDVCSGRLAT
ncbi:hypothetical protein M2163_009243 [Streptomyces sp. SAI-135]|nr:hypothetical protein [Streptomyces sp. SAI-090]MDH6545960.1 hypothetical protein [Streptomyces sp. SAI-041]MDH6589974.1 hypothetical protein [Streptomyces sp. SAI-133]MDH6622135.1 hypothetical protein [Streptomyces sp. SAI-135]